MAQSVVLLSVTKAEERKRKLKTDSLGKTQRSESQKGEIAVSMRQLVMELIGGVGGGKSALHAKSHTKVRQGAGREKGSCVFSIDLSAFNCRQAANETRPANGTVVRAAAHKFEYFETCFHSLSRAHSPPLPVVSNYSGLCFN